MKKKVDHRTPNALRLWKAVPLSISLGFLLPTHSIVATSFSGELHQLFTRLWPLRPIYVLLLQESLVFTAPLSSSTVDIRSQVYAREAWSSHNFTWILGIRMVCFFYSPRLAVSLFLKFARGLCKYEVLDSISCLKVYTVSSLSGSIDVWIHRSAYCS